MQTHVFGGSAGSDTENPLSFVAEMRNAATDREASTTEPKSLRFVSIGVAIRRPSGNRT
jgi:hypothetical protein